ncbi:hypothetical protein BDV93DRAFT_523257 [Ceratobasidium sp. AG-I]|nr:hypothetical protein BDV93DRAFT_523257 [Ceratobasidium sp. AG-I]
MPREADSKPNYVISWVHYFWWIIGCIITLGYASKYLKKVRNLELLDPAHHITAYTPYSIRPLSPEEMGFKVSERSKQQREWDRLNLTLSVITATSAAALAIPSPFSSPNIFWFSIACFSAAFGLSLEGLILIAYLTVFATGSSSETVGRIAKGKHFLKGKSGPMAFVTSLPTAITTYASLFLLAGLISMTIVKGKGTLLQDHEAAYTAIVLIPVCVMLLSCAATVVSCEVVAWTEDKIMQKRAAERQLKGQDAHPANEEGVLQNEKATVEMLQTLVNELNR